MKREVTIKMLLNREMNKEQEQVLVADLFDIFVEHFTEEELSENDITITVVPLPEEESQGKDIHDEPPGLELGEE